MAQGRGNAIYPAALLLIIVGLQGLLNLFHLASAATLTVGGSKGWDVGVDYTSWAAGHTFNVGDILFFPYLQAQHNVVVVDKAGYDACSDANASATFSDGNANVTLSTSGAHYYLCSVVGHCSAGMKLAVTVSTTVAPPTASTSPASAPTPSKTPSSSPIKVPSAAPSSTSTPSSAPSSTSTPSSAPSAPAPSPEVPASAPTPSLVPAPAPTVGPPASAPSAPGSTPSSTGTPPSSPPAPPNAAHSLLTSASILLPLLALWAALFV